MYSPKVSTPETNPDGSSAKNYGYPEYDEQPKLERQPISLTTKVENKDVLQHVSSKLGQTVDVVTGEKLDTEILDTDDDVTKIKKIYALVGDKPVNDVKKVKVEWRKKIRQLFRQYVRSNHGTFHDLHFLKTSFHWRYVMFKINFSNFTFLGIG